ncbi:MAG TPA: gluconokinase [Gemmatimonadaceae bacterium]|nr:gluconokinase [Gemmatimonadaceae bacterium]
MASPRIIVLMGPAGAGKTTVGLALAQSLGWRFLDADDFHSPENVAKMHSGVGLTDADREPWLRAIHDALHQLYAQGVNAVLACSALKEEYRRAIAPENAAGEMRFVYLHAPASVLHERLAKRVGHYAGPQLLASQLETLEEPRDALWVDATCAPQEIVTRIRRELGV